MNPCSSAGSIPRAFSADCPGSRAPGACLGSSVASSAVPTEQLGHQRLPPHATASPPLPTAYPPAFVAPGSGWGPRSVDGRQRLLLWSSCLGYTMGIVPASLSFSLRRLPPHRRTQHSAAGARSPPLAPAAAPHRESDQFGRHFAGGLGSSLVLQIAASRSKCDAATARKLPIASRQNSQQKV